MLDFVLHADENVFSEGRFQPDYIELYRENMEFWQLCFSIYLNFSKMKCF